jgi:hypothetical protein
MVVFTLCATYHCIGTNSFIYPVCNLQIYLRIVKKSIYDGLSIRFTRNDLQEVCVLIRNSDYRLSWGTLLCRHHPRPRRMNISSTPLSPSPPGSYFYASSVIHVIVSNTVFGWIVWTGIVVATWVVAFIIANIILSLCDMFILMNSHFGASISTS